MTASVYDFAEIAKEARLRALEGFNQNEVKPVEMPSDSNPHGGAQDVQVNADYFYGGANGGAGALGAVWSSFTAPEQDEA